MTMGPRIADDRILLGCEGSIGSITFNHPEKRNAITADMWRGLPAALSALEAEARVRVIVLRGAGDKAFVAGADLSTDGGGGDDVVASYEKLSKTAIDALRRAKKPTIAAITGYCIGAGVDIALQCDIRIATEDSRFAIPAARIGLGYNLDGMRDVVNAIGSACAKELFFTARTIAGAEAWRIGLVNQVVSREDFETTLREFADAISKNAPLSILAAKLAIDASVSPADPETERLTRDAIKACFESADYREGRRAFAEKRGPEFRGE